MKLSHGITNNRLSMVTLNIDEYPENLIKIVEAFSKKSKTCYICISKKYVDIVSELKSIGMDIKKFFFIDMLSSHYKPHTHAENCKFLSSPDLIELKNEIIKVTQHTYKNILFDSFSKLLIYHDSFSLLKFTNELISETKDADKLFLIVKENHFLFNEIETLTKDIEMFIDNKLNLEENNK